jgi:hypothetical protein
MIIECLDHPKFLFFPSFLHHPSQAKPIGIVAQFGSSDVLETGTSINVIHRRRIYIKSHSDGRVAEKAMTSILNLLNMAHLKTLDDRLIDFVAPPTAQSMGSDRAMSSRMGVRMMFAEDESDYWPWAGTV